MAEEMHVMRDYTVVVFVMQVSLMIVYYRFPVVACLNRIVCRRGVFGVYIVHRLLRRAKT